MKKNKVYVAGPISLGDQLGNVIEAIKVGEELSKKGYVPFIPHLNYFWHHIHKHPEKFWYQYDNEWLKMCDYIYRIPGKSIGADAEMKLAKKLGIKILNNDE